MKKLFKIIIYAWILIAAISAFYYFTIYSPQRDNQIMKELKLINSNIEDNGSSIQDVQSGIDDIKSGLNL